MWPHLQRIGPVFSAPHGLPQLLVSGKEGLGLHWQLALNVWGTAGGQQMGADGVRPAERSRAEPDAKIAEPDVCP